MHEFIIKYLVQIPVIISDKNIFASSLKILLILFKNFISHKTSHLQLTFNYILIRDRYEKRISSIYYSFLYC